MAEYDVTYFCSEVEFKFSNLLRKSEIHVFDSPVDFRFKLFFTFSNFPISICSFELNLRWFVFGESFGESFRELIGGNGGGGGGACDGRSC